MGLRDNLRAFSERWANEQRAITPQDFGRGIDVGDRWFTTRSGESVTLDSVLGIQHVWSCVTLLVNDIRKLPVDAFRDLGEDRKASIPRPSWMRYPDPQDMNTKFSDHVAQAVFSLMVDGNAFIYAFPSVFNVETLLLLDPTRVDIRGGRFHVRGYPEPLTAMNVRHIRNLVKPGATRGMNPIQATREGFGLTAAAERYAQRFFDKGAVMSGVIETPAGAVVDADRLKKDFDRNHDAKGNAHAVGVLTGGATFRSLSFSPEDTQFLTLRKVQKEDAAAMFHIPPFKIGSTEPGAVAYASTSNARIEYVQSAIEPIVSLLEDAYSDFIPGDDTYVKFNLNALLRGDPKARHEAYSVGLQNRFLKVDEVRALEDMQPFGESNGGGFLDTPNSVVVDPRVTEAVALIGAGADPAETLAALGLPPITFTDRSAPVPAPEVAA